MRIALLTNMFNDFKTLTATKAETKDKPLVERDFILGDVPISISRYLDCENPPESVIEQIEDLAPGETMKIRSGISRLTLKRTS